MVSAAIMSRPGPADVEPRWVSDRKREFDSLRDLYDGDPVALEAFVREHLDQQYRIARRFFHCEHECADVVQEAMVAALRALPNFHGTSNISTWLHRITVNCCLMRLRTRRAHPTVSMDELAPQFDEDGRHLRDCRPWRNDMALQPPSSEIRAAIRTAIEALPEPYRVVLLLRDIEGLDTNETAEILELSVVNVKTRLCRARQALRALLEAELGTADAEAARCA